MSKARVLIVEDEAVVSMALEEKLQKLGYDVVGTMESGPDAIKAVEDLKPDIALMDIRLEGHMDGVEAATIINREFRIPVIYLTAHTDSKTLDRAKITSPAGYLVKPCSERDINIALEIALHKKSSPEKSVIEDTLAKNGTKEPRGSDPISMTINISDQTSLPEAVNELKERLIREGLNRSGGNVTQAAKLLGVSRDSFNYMVKALGLKKKVAF